MRRLSMACGFDVAVPSRVGIVHLGLGVFHRAHQATFSDTWGIAAYTQRSATVRDQLAPQDCLYTVLTRDATTTDLRVVGAIREVGLAGEAAARMADAAVQVVTLTVTEKAYVPGGPVIGRLVTGLDLRRRADAGPITVLSCDNLTGNGAVLRGLVLAAAPPALAEWMSASVTFPNSMVDRIVPAPTPELRTEVAERLGVIDEAAVGTEPFRQWVIEDTFAGERPPWDGALFTSDVAPYERAKLRLLNATHSLLAYAGALRGHTTIAAAVQDPVLFEAASALMSKDAAPTLSVDFDLAAYQASVLNRFANPFLGHRTAQVASDGSLKLPIRLLGTARERLAVGAEPTWVAFAVAAWMMFLARRPELVDDPLAARLLPLAASATSAAALVDALLGVPEVFGPEVDPRWRALLVDRAEQLWAAH